MCVCVSHPRKVEEYLNLMYMSSYSVYSKVAFLRKTRKDHCNLVLGVQRMVIGETESLGANMLSWFCISSMVELYEFFFCSMLGIQCVVFTQHLCPLKCTHCLRCDSTAYAVQCRSTCCGVRSWNKRALYTVVQYI